MRFIAVVSLWLLRNVYFTTFILKEIRNMPQKKTFSKVVNVIHSILYALITVANLPEIFEKDFISRAGDFLKINTKETNTESTEKHEIGKT